MCCSCPFTRRYSSNRGCLHFLHRVICLSSVGHSVCIRSQTVGWSSLTTVPPPFGRSRLGVFGSTVGVGGCPPTVRPLRPSETPQHNGGVWGRCPFHQVSRGAREGAHHTQRPRRGAEAKGRAAAGKRMAVTAGHPGGPRRGARGHHRHRSPLAPLSTSHPREGRVIRCLSSRVSM